jgi:adenosylcobinamide-phosphate synthase
MAVRLLAPRPAGLLLGYLADLVFGDPRRGHPVAGFGRVAMLVERRLYKDRRSAGILHIAVLVGATAGVGAAADRLFARRPVLRTLAIAAASWAVLGGRSLQQEARAVASQLDQGDLPAARIQITHLVGRDPETLDAAGIARACVESVAENTSDAVVGPLFWGAVAGLPGLVGYRAINTLDAMVGHRSARYLRFGWAAARLDDVVNLLPSRLTALVVAALAPVLGGRPDQALRIVARDASRHPSPNAGPVEAAFAGALGLTLGGVNTYGHTSEDRGTLGEGRAPTSQDISRAARLSGLVGAVCAGAAVMAAGGWRALPGRTQTCDDVE